MLVLADDLKAHVKVWVILDKSIGKCLMMHNLDELKVYSEFTK